MATRMSQTFCYNLFDYTAVLRAPESNGLIQPFNRADLRISRASAALQLP